MKAERHVGNLRLTIFKSYSLDVSTKSEREKKLVSPPLRGALQSLMNKAAADAD